jgi:hypothetical protein
MCLISHTDPLAYDTTGEMCMPVWAARPCAHTRASIQTCRPKLHLWMACKEGLFADRYIVKGRPRHTALDGYLGAHWVFGIIGSACDRTDTAEVSKWPVIEQTRR